MKVEYWLQQIELFCTCIRGRNLQIQCGSGHLSAKQQNAISSGLCRHSAFISDNSLCLRTNYSRLIYNIGYTSEQGEVILPEPIQDFPPGLKKNLKAANPQMFLAPEEY